MYREITLKNLTEEEAQHVFNAETYLSAVEQIYQEVRAINKYSDFETEAETELSEKMFKSICGIIMDHGIDV